MKSPRRPQDHRAAGPGRRNERALRAIKRLLAQPEFVVAVVLLGAAAATLNSATEYLQLHFRKQAVPMRVSALDAPDGIPAVLGHWVQINRDTPLDPDTEHILGTRQYIKDRAYLDMRVVAADERDTLKAMSEQDREAELRRIAEENPTAVLHLGVFYYTGLVDTVAHIPERCYIADGYDVISSQTRSDVNFGKYPDGSDRIVSFRYINFEDQTGQRRESRNVAYLFHVNGHYESDSLGVRRSLENLFEPYGYYAKIELMTVSPSHSGDPAGGQAGPAKTLAAYEDFLNALLPEFERCMPDWQKLHAKPRK